MFDFWFELPTVLRIVLGLALLGLAGLIFLASEGRLYAIGLAVVGLVFIVFSGAGSNKDGYNF